MDTLIFVLHVMSCLFLIGLILIQHGKGASLGAAFGGASQTVFGSRGPATFLNKLTIIVAVVFLSASIYLANIAKHESATSVIDEAKGLTAPAATETTPITEKVTPTTAAEGEETTIQPETIPTEEKTE